MAMDHPPAPGRPARHGSRAAARAGGDDATGRPPTLVPPPDFGSSLRYWRHKRGLSQLELSIDGGLSQRHLSFLESGRAQPSREMVLRLGSVLQVPLRQRNLLLTAAGFAPLYRERTLVDPDLQPVQRALELMLRQQQPYPAVVVDRLWNVASMNEPAHALIGWLLGPPDSRPPHLAHERNLIRLMLEPDGAKPFVANWRDVAADVMHWIHREAMNEGAGGAARELLERLLAIDGVPGDWQVPAGDPRHAPFLALRLVREEVSLDLFTTITTLGTPHDVTLQELRVECFFPVDEATDRWFRSRG